MDKNYLDTLKNLNLRPKKVKVESKEEVLIEAKTSDIILEQKKVILRELFVQQGEIEAMPKGLRRDMAILRLGIIAEMDASNLYERMADLADNPDLKKLMLDVSKEEKTHSGEFVTLLRETDPQYEKEEEAGEDEVEDLLGI